ncbi:hypothetical protein CF327_g3791 [Tilletia walkeri]|nr:hypothetical protein CF327_g3791 [Tilletia walkeri]
MSVEEAVPLGLRSSANGNPFSPMASGASRTATASSDSELKALIHSAIAQNQQQFNNLSTLLHSAVEGARRESDARLHLIAEYLNRNPPPSMIEQGVATGSSLGEPWQQDCNMPLQKVDTNIPSGSQRSDSANSRKTDKGQGDAALLTKLASRLAQVEAERDSIKEKYKREHKKQKDFKAWWEANLAAVVSQDLMDVPSREEQVSDGSPLKKRRIESAASTSTLRELSKAVVTPAKRKFSTTAVHTPATPYGEAPPDVLVDMSPRRPDSDSRADPNLSPEKSSASLRTSFANLHLNRSDKSLIRSLGLSLPKSPVKKVVELEPSETSVAAEQPSNLVQSIQRLPERPLSLNLASIEGRSTASEGSTQGTEKIESQLFTDQGWVTPSNATASKSLDHLTKTAKQSGSSDVDHTVSPAKTPGNASKQSVKTPSTSTSVGPSSSKGAVHRVRYDLDPALNRGEAYEYVEVIRGREARKNLIATDCLECKEWYERVGPPPSPPGPVYPPYTEFGKQMQAAREERKRRESAKGASASSGLPSHARCKHHGQADLASARARGDEEVAGPSTSAVDTSDRDTVIVYQITEEDQRQAHRQAISRHRNTAPPSLTPPGYWNIAFPSTQQVREMNEETEVRRQAQQARLAQDPRYKARTIR